MAKNDFPRILTLLRKEKGFSQKKAAADLEISQALLSHYEKGIRECGLNFVLRAASYYDVSCDYLLGRTPHRNGAVFFAKDIPDESASPADNLHSLNEYDRKIIVNSIHIVFGILEKINSETLTKETASYLSSAIYKVFRTLHAANPKNPNNTFSLNRRLFDAEINMQMLMSEARAKFLLSGESIEGCLSIKREQLPLLTSEALMQEFPLFAPSLFDLIENTEKGIGSVVIEA